MYEKTESDTPDDLSLEALESAAPERQKRKPRKNREANAGKTPDVRVTTFANWQEIARWYAELEKGRTEPTPEIRAKTQELIQGRATELDKIQALYDYVSKNIRYVSLSFGLGRYQPHAASGSFHESIWRLQGQAHAARRDARRRRTFRLTRY